MKKTTTVALFAGAVSLVGSTFARNQNISTPETTAFPDAESSLTQPFSGWREETQRFEIQFELRTTNETVYATETCCVQCAFGNDANGDEDLEPEETDLVLGIDCGEAFARDERVDAAPSPRQNEVGVSIRRDEGVASTGEIATFDLSRVFDRAWNRVKVTTRNTPTNMVASVIATFRNNPTLVIIR